MNTKLSDKISNYIFIALMIASAVVLGMFFFVGYDNYETIAGKSIVAPMHTGTLIYWMYALVAAGILCVAFFVVKDFFGALKSNPADAVKGILGILLVVALFGVSYAVASDAPVMVNNEPFTDSNLLILTDVCIYVQYVLLAVATVCTIVSLAGVFNAFNKVKA